MSWWSRHFPGVFCSKGGLHDWEYTEVKETAQIHHDAYCPDGSRLEYGGELHKPYKRVCLKCARFEDRITPLRERFQAEMERHCKRQARAKEMLNEA